MSALQQPGHVARIVDGDDDVLGVEAVPVGEPDGLHRVVVLHRRHGRTRPQLAACLPHDDGQPVDERRPSVVQIEDTVASQPEL